MEGGDMIEVLIVENNIRNTLILLKVDILDLIVKWIQHVLIKIWLDTTTFPQSSCIKVAQSVIN